jgi:hypothetical protein
MLVADQSQPDGIEGVLTAAAAVAGVVSAFQPERYTGPDAARLVKLFARLERLGAAGMGLAARRVEETRAWQSSGARNAAEWLGRATGTTAGQAAQTLSTSKQLRDQPDLDSAVRSGALSPTQATEIAQTAKEAPEQAAGLIDHAQSDTMQGLRAQCQAVRSVRRPEDQQARHRRIHQRRYLHSWVDADGAGRLDARMTADALARLRAQLSPFEQEQFDAARHQRRFERHDAYALDALLDAVATGSEVLADDTVDRDSDIPPPGADVSTGAAQDHPAQSDRPDAAEEHRRPPDGRGRPDASKEHRRSADGPSPAGRETSDPADDGVADPAGGDRSSRSGRQGGSRRRRPNQSPASVIVRIDLAALNRGHAEPGECCEIDGVGPIPVEVAEALMADAHVAVVLTNGVDIRRVVHLGRSVTALQRTALMVRDPECVVPGCHVRTRLEIDHVTGWAKTHKTRLDDLARLCHYHHAQKTREGWELRGPPGSWSFTAPDGTTVGPDPPPTGGSPPAGRAIPDARPRADGQPRPTAGPTRAAGVSAVELSLRRRRHHSSERTRQNG